MYCILLLFPTLCSYQAVKQVRSHSTVNTVQLEQVLSEQIYKLLADPPPCLLPLYMVPVVAGFPSPAEDYLEGKLDLNQYLVRHPSATYYVRVSGDSMQGAGIYSGDLLVVDRSLSPQDGNIVIAVVNGELTVKRLRREDEHLLLVAENSCCPPLEISEHTDLQIWGVVTCAVHIFQ